MIDPFSDVAFNPGNSFVPTRYLPSSLHQNPDQLKKLPKIAQKQQPNISIRNRTRTFIRSSTKLPNLKLQSNFTSANEHLKLNEQNHLLNIHHREINNKTNVLIQRVPRQKSEGDQFVSEIEKKLKLVLDGHGSNVENYAEASNSDEQFQKKVSRNREMIKKQRMRRQALNESNCEQNISQNITHSLNPQSDKKLEQKNSSQQDLQKVALGVNKIKSKQESLYEKRVKDYRQQSIGNKFLAKKKQIIQRQQNIVKKVAQLMDQQNKNNFQTLKNRSPVRITAKKSNKLINATTRDQDLFENLHNILLNPNRRSQNDVGAVKQKEKEKEKQKQKSKKTRQNLQQKIKIIENKLALQRRQDLDLIDKLQKSIKEVVNLKQEQLQKTEPTLSGTVDQQCWRKVDVSNCGLETKKTNFEQQVERLNKYFQRSERSLQKHIQNQGRILNLNNAKKKPQSSP